MNVEFYNFSKKRNSTKQPASGSGTSFTNVQLKQDCSIVTPVLQIAVSSMPVASVAPVNTMTYCYIPKFSRYYFIEDWVYIPGMWEAHLVLDVLASHKTEIGSTSAYVERSSSTYDGSIIDRMYPANTSYSISYASLSNPFATIAPQNGSYVVGIINSDANLAGAITYYALTQTQLQSLLSYIFGNDIWNASAITEVSQGLFKSMFNPFQYIVSCMWLPVAVNTMGQNTGYIKLGYYTTNVIGTIVNSLYVKSYCTGDIPTHPQASSRGSYLNYAPYTDVTIYVPPFGSIPIDTAFLSVGRHLQCPIWLDHITGEATLRISTSPTDPIRETYVCAERSAMLGVPIQLAQVMSDYTHTVQTMQSGFSGGIAGIIAGAIGATVQSSLDAKFPSVSTSGSNGSFMTTHISGLILTKFTRIVDGDNTDLGRPLMQVKTINTLSGYIKCGEAHFSAPCFAGERSMIEDFMVSGFFYE